MSWGYLPSLVGDRDKIRLEIGDTVDLTESNESLHDEEIAGLLARHGTWPATVAPAARALAMKLAALPVSKTVGETQLVQKRVDFLLAKATEWEHSHQGGGVRLASPYAGGASLADIETKNANTDRPRLPFTRPL